MKVAYYYPWIVSKGGAEKVLLETLKGSKHEFTVFTFNYDKENTFEELKEFNIQSLSKKSIKVKGIIQRGVNFGRAALFTKIPNLKSFDVFNIATAGIGELITLRNHSIPIMAFCHTILRPAHEMYEEYKKTRFKGWKKPFFIGAVHGYRVLEKIAWKYIDLTLCNSENTRGRIIRAKVIDPERIFVLNPGVNVDDFVPGKYKKYFLAPGRIQWYKRIELSIRAFKILYEKKKIRKFRLKIVGHLMPKDKPILDFLKKEAEGLPVDFHISVSRKELRGYFSNCYAMLFTAKDEDWGIVPLEAMSCAKPVISVNEGGPKESVLHNKTGFLVDATPEAIAEKMEELIKNTRKHKKMGEEARKHVRKYDWKVFTKKYDEYLEKTKEIRKK